jgi:hypothetical protein
MAVEAGGLAGPVAGVAGPSRLAGQVAMAADTGSLLALAIPGLTAPVGIVTVDAGRRLAAGPGRQVQGLAAVAPSPTVGIARRWR